MLYLHLGIHGISQAFYPIFLKIQRTSLSSNSDNAYCSHFYNILFSPFHLYMPCSFLIYLYVTKYYLKIWFSYILKVLLFMIRCM